MLLLLWCVGQLSILSAVAGNVARHQNTIYTVFSCWSVSAPVPDMSTNVAAAAEYN